MDWKEANMSNLQIETLEDVLQGFVTNEQTLIPGNTLQDQFFFIMSDRALCMKFVGFLLEVLGHSMAEHEALERVKTTEQRKTARKTLLRIEKRRAKRANSF